MRNEKNKNKILKSIYGGGVSWVANKFQSPTFQNEKIYRKTFYTIDCKSKSTKLTYNEFWNWYSKLDTSAKVRGEVR